MSTKKVDIPADTVTDLTAAGGPLKVLTAPPAIQSYPAQLETGSDSVTLVVHPGSAAPDPFFGLSYKEGDDVWFHGRGPGDHVFVLSKGGPSTLIF